MRYTASFGFFLVTTVLWLLPLVRHLDSSVLKEPSDSTNEIRDLWAMEHQGKTPFTIKRDFFNGAPEGHPVSLTVQVANAFEPAILWVLKDAVGLVAALNLFLLAGFVLTGFVAFVLLDRLRLHFLASLFGGYVLAFNPWQFEQAGEGHAAFAHAWIYPLTVLTLLGLRTRRTLGSAALAGLALALAFYISSYTGFIALLLVAVAGAVDFIRGTGAAARLQTLAGLGAISLTTLLALTPVAVTWLRHGRGVSDVFARPLEDLQRYGAASTSYLLPSEHHPVLGGVTRRFTTFTFATTEKQLFFGYTTILLALAAVALLARRHPQIRAFPERLHLAIVAAALVPVAFVTSLPRLVNVAGIEVATPAYVVGHFTTVLRVYARFGVLVGLGLVLLAALALHVLAGRRRGAWVGAALVVAAAFELATGPPIPTWAAKSPPSYSTWLAGHPGGIVANYPIESFDLAEVESYYQVFHGHPLYTDWLGTSGTREDAIRIVSRNLADRFTPRILAAEHVRYVVVHDEVYRAISEPPPELSPPTFTPAATFGDVRIFVVHSKPIAPDPLIRARGAEIARALGWPSAEGEYRGSFYAPEQQPDGRHFRWMREDGTIDARNPGEAGKFRFVALGWSANRPRRVELLDADGGLLGAAEVATSLTEIELGPFTLPSGGSRLVLHASPAPEPLGAGDPRVASVFLGPFVLEPVYDLDAAASR